MSEENLIMGDDFSWDDEDNVDLTPPTGGKKHFAHLKMYVEKVTKSFTAGDFVSISGVKGGDMNEKDNAGNMKLKGWKAGGKERLFVLVATQYAQDGSAYQLVKQFSSKNYNKDRRHVWNELQMPALKELDGKRLTVDGLYVEFDDIPTGDTFTPEGESEAKDIPYWGNFKVYKDKEALDAANKEFFAQFSKDNGAASEDFWPETWVASNSVQQMVDYAKTVEGSHAEIATALMLDNAVASNGEPVNVALVLSKCLDVPEPMIKL